MQKIMILGAGIYQVPLIKKASEMGFYTIVVSIPGDYPGFKYANKVYYENTTDTTAVLEIAKTEKIDGIVTTGTDVALATLGYVCDELGLKGVSKDSASKSCNKILMKQSLSSANVNTAKYVVASTSDSLNSIINKCDAIGYPLVIKAVDSSGSRGITVVKDSSMVETAVNSVKEISRTHDFLIEEFLDGEEYGADAFIIDGQIQFIIPHGKYVYYAKTGIPVGHYAPYNDQFVVDSTITEASKAIKAMGYDNCAVNFDIMLHNNKPYIIEVGARCGATCIPELISLYCGYDYYEQMINACLNNNCNATPIPSKLKASASKLLFSTKSGTLKAINGVNDITICRNACEGIYEVVVDKQPGDEIPAFEIGPHRIGHVIAYADTLSRAEELLNDVVNKIEFELE